ncbi:MAG: sodium:proton antiporter [Candidatus Cyclobacteriaceae bacterium M3_2C_046]
MKSFSIFLILITVLNFSANCENLLATPDNLPQKVLQEHEESEQSNEHISTEDDHTEAAHKSPPIWSVIPFVLLLLMIATGPLFYEHFWHKNYPIIAIILAAIVVSFYLFFLKNFHYPVHSAFEYIQFISLLASLYIASGGIWINVDRQSTPVTNIGILAIGAVIANLIGTTGASMLLIRPFMRINQHRIKPYHVVFFIFIISNIGGSLTPIGDPPLFLGFLKGVPFFWTLSHNIVPWFFAITVICIIFYFFDKKNAENHTGIEPSSEYSNKITMAGSRNFLWLGVVIIAVFLDPNIFDFVPGIYYHGQKFSFLRELIMLAVAYFSYKFASKKALTENEFSFEPIREVTFIFIGIFGTMMPALELVGNFARSEAGAALINQNTLYWGTGMLSGFLDNAPTYLNFLAAGMASQGGEISQLQDVRNFAQGGVYQNSVLFLKSISIAAVFFGAMTYIGNGPNFMVKSISEERGIKMPSFFGYMIRFSLPILIPLFVIVWLIFFAFKPV